MAVAKAVLTAGAIGRWIERWTHKEAIAERPAQIAPRPSPSVPPAPVDPAPSGTRSLALGLLAVLFLAGIGGAFPTPAGSKAVIEIDAASASTPNQDIETEIKREPWFDTARHPTARFETTAFKSKDGDRYDVEGQLTLRGVTKPAILGATISVADDPSRPGTLRAKATGNVTLSRTAFGIGQGQWRDVAVVADEVAIHIEIVARRSKSGP